MCERRCYEITDREAWRGEGDLVEFYQRGLEDIRHLANFRNCPNYCGIIYSFVKDAATQFCTHVQLFVTNRR